MSTHNICLHGENEKNTMWIPLLSGAVTAHFAPIVGKHWSMHFTQD